MTSPNFRTEGRPHRDLPYMVGYRGWEEEKEEEEEEEEESARGYKT